MADIFISYAREDRSRIEPFAKALEDRGWSVFWDRTIPAGKTWRQVIGEALDNARSVIVAWSKISVNSRWVQEEADNGLERNILIPALIDDVRPPLGFGSVQAADLIDWQPSKSSTEFEKLIANLSEFLDPPLLEVKGKQQKGEKSELKQDQERKVAEDMVARREVEVLMHRACFEGFMKPFLFIKVINLYRDHDIEITHAWMQTNPKVHILLPERPLPVRIKPYETWEAWIDEFSIPEQFRNYPYNLGRVKLSTGQTFQSKENKDVPERGYVAGRRDKPG